MALRNHDRVHLPRWYKAKNKETEAIGLYFQRNYDKFRKGLIHNIKVLKVAGYQINEFMTLASSYTFLAIGICADGVSVCS